MGNPPNPITSTAKDFATPLPAAAASASADHVDPLEMEAGVM
jgi:hypothetical protein